MEKNIVERVMERIKIDRAQQKFNYEYITLEDFFYHASHFHDVIADLINIGMSETNGVRIFQDTLERMAEYRKKVENSLSKKSESLIFAISAATAMSMNMEKEVTFLDIVKAVMIEKNKDDSDKCVTMRETLMNFGVSLDYIMDYNNNGLNNNDVGVFEINESEEENEGFSVKEEDSGEKINIAAFVKELTDREVVKNFNYAIGRSGIINEITQGLNKKKKSSVLLVGKSGVGKSAIVESFAISLSKNEIIGFEDHKLYEFSVAGMFSGSRYRGDFEKKFNAFIEFIKNKKCIIFIDEIHSIQSNASSDSDINLSSMLKPLMESGKIKLIGTTNYDKKRKVIDKDPSLLRRFDVINVEEVSKEECVEILTKTINSYEQYHKVRFGSEILKRAVDLSVRYIHDKQLPDKVFDIIDNVGSIAKMKKSKMATLPILYEVISKMANIPVENISSEGLDDLLSLSDNLNKTIFGQSEAVEALSDEIIISKSNIGDNGKRKPLGSFMFAGPTGVGKTELTNELARLLNMQLIRLDMSEYMESHSVAKLVGSPPGYVGHSESSEIIKSIESNPYSIVLFDEFEKAHPDVQNVLLQILDNGKMKDPSGKEISFRNAIVILTTNAGANASTKVKIGFGSNNDATSVYQKEQIQKELERIFKPEFRNRLDHIVYFNSLSREMSKNITIKKLNNVKKDLLENYNIKADFSNEIIDYITDFVFENDNKMGARPIDRKIKQLITKQISLLVIKKSIQSGDDITITNKYEKLEIVKNEKVKKTNKQHIEESLSKVEI